MTSRGDCATSGTALGTVQPPVPSLTLLHYQAHSLRLRCHLEQASMTLELLCACLQTLQQHRLTWSLSETSKQAHALVFSLSRAELLSTPYFNI